MTRKDVLDYAQMRIFEAGVTGPFTSIGDAWAAAKTQYTEDHPDAMIKLLLGDLVRKQAAAESQGGPDVCSGPSRARGQASIDAHEIVDLLWCIADEYGGQRVWGEGLELREFQRKAGFSEKRSRLETAIGAAINGHTANGHVVEEDQTLLRAIADAVEQLGRENARTRFEREASQIVGP